MEPVLTQEGLSYFEKMDEDEIGGSVDLSVCSGVCNKASSDK